MEFSSNDDDGVWTAGAGAVIFWAQVILSLHSIYGVCLFVVRYTQRLLAFVVGAAGFEYRYIVEGESTMPPGSSQPLCICST